MTINIIKNKKIYSDFFLQNVRNFSSTLEAFNALEISCADKIDDQKIVKQGKLSFIKFLKKLTSQIETVIKNNSEHRFDIDSSQLIDIELDITEIDPKYSEFLKLTIKGMETITDFIFLTANNYHQACFSPDGSKKISHEISAFKGLLSKNKA